jgi:hypothetical protein
MNQRRYQMEPLNNNLWQILDKETGTQVGQGSFGNMALARHHLNKAHYLANPIPETVKLQNILTSMNTVRVSANNTAFADVRITSDGSLNIYHIHGEDPKIIDKREINPSECIVFPKVKTTSETLTLLAINPFSDSVTRVLYDLTHYADITINDKGHLIIHALVGTSPTINDLRENK